MKSLSDFVLEKEGKKLVGRAAPKTEGGVVAGPVAGESKHLPKGPN